MSTLGGVQYTGVIMSKPGAYPDECGGDIMSTPGDVQYTGGIP